MKTGILIVTILIGILVIGALVYFAYSSMNNPIAKNSDDNNVVSGDYRDFADKTGGTVQSQTHEIKISNFAFSPVTITIKKGDTVKWTNLDSVRHTITSDSGSELNSELLSKTESYSHTFSDVGTYDYYCVPHSYMKAKVVVE